MLNQTDGRKQRLVRMLWMPLEVGGVKRWNKLHIAPDLSNELILGEN